MDEQKAREILKDYIKDDGGLYCLGHYMAYDAGSKEITLDSDFRTEELEAIIWWMKNSSNADLERTARSDGTLQDFVGNSDSGVTDD